VLAHWRAIKPAYRITLEDGTSLVAGGDHRFLTERGWKFVSETHACDSERRPHLTTRNKLMGTGGFVAASAKNLDYRSGYLCGVIRGDALLASYQYQRVGRVHGDQHQFRLALCDTEALQRTQEYLRRLADSYERVLFQKAAGARKVMRAIRSHARPDVDRIRELIALARAAHSRMVCRFPGRDFRR
jgi:hypothetical protein